MALHVDVVRRYAHDLREWAACVRKRRRRALAGDPAVAEALNGMFEELDAAARRVLVIAYSREKS